MPPGERHGACGPTENEGLRQLSGGYEDTLSELAQLLATGFARRRVHGQNALATTSRASRCSRVNRVIATASKDLHA